MEVYLIEQLKNTSMGYLWNMALWKLIDKFPMVFLSDINGGFSFPRFQFLYCSAQQTGPLTE